MGISLKGVNLGYMGLDMSMIVEKPELQNVPYQCPAIAYIIEHPDGRILWETGISTRATDEWLSVWQELVDLSPAPPEACLENRLKELGLGPEDFRSVVMGHLHTDHAGGLRESEKWRSAVDTIRTLATEREAFIFPSHDTTGIKQFKTRSEMRTIEFWPGYEYE